MRGDALKGHLDLLLLASVEHEPLHGYALIEELRLQSGGSFDLLEGTVYPALHRLERAGLLASRWSAQGKRRKRVYRLTRKGRVALAAERRAWREFSESVELVVGGAG